MSTNAGRRGRPRPRLRTLLLLVVLIPTLGLIGVAAVSATAANEERNAAQRVNARTEVLLRIVDTRLAVAAEETQSSVISVASDLGVDLADLERLFGVDYRSALRNARRAVAEDPTLGSLPEISTELAALENLRGALDRNEASFEDVREVFDTLIATLDAVWEERFDVLRAEIASDNLSGSLFERTDAVASTFAAWQWGSLRAGLAVRLFQGEQSPELIGAFIDATARQRAATEAFAGELGPNAQAVWDARAADPATMRFETTLDDAAAALLTGASAVADAASIEFGSALADGEPWAAGLSELVRAAAEDLQDDAAAQVRGADDALRSELALLAAIAAATLTATLVLARSVTRPIRRLESAVHEVQQGRFDLAPIPPSGPREIYEAATAFNEMATTLAAVEAHAVALADDAEASSLNDEIPGRTGRALQVALNRLRASMQGAERRRHELEHAATHDGLTGLLNRNAALAVIENMLAQAERTQQCVMVLFVDLDGFKAINDKHGHAAGDAALCATAAALRASTRDADVAARLGGDEFLIAGYIADPMEVEVLAERVRDAVASHSPTNAQGRLALQCSIGMTVTSGEATTVDALIRRADSALYTAKRRGRDQAAWDDPTDARAPQ